MEAIRTAIEMGALAIESLAVVVILIATIHGTIRFILHTRPQVHNAYEQYKVRLGKALLLGLGLLVATIDGQPYYVRHMKNMKASLPVPFMTGTPFNFWTFICGGGYRRGRSRGRATWARIVGYCP
jgi:hypothetical protein